MVVYNEVNYRNPDSKKIFIREWIPEKDPDCIVLYVHGLGSHSGRMGHWAERFLAHDIGFIAFDHRGHGKSDGKHGQPVDMNYMVEDTGRMVTRTKDQFPKARIVLYGHSMGGCTVLKYAMTGAGNIDGMIASSPWLKLTTPPSELLRKVLKPLSPIIKGLALSNGLDANEISSDPQEVKKYMEDPLIHNKISIGLFMTVYQAGLDILNEDWMPGFPQLLMHGTGDMITSPKATQALAEKQEGSTQLKLWKDGKHELHHEPFREELFEYIIDWMKAKELIVL